MQNVSFHVPGKPQGKARAKTVRHADSGSSISYTPDHTVLYENFIKDQFLNYSKGFYMEREKPVEIRIIARFLPPKSASRKRRLDMLEGREFPLKKPDADNIIKVVLDALNGVAYHDDVQVMYVTAKKVYSAIEGLDITVAEYTG